MIEILKSVSALKSPFHTEIKFPNLLNEIHIQESITSHRQIILGKKTYYSQIFSDYKLPSDDFRERDAIIKFLVIETKLDTKQNEFVKQYLRKALENTKEISHFALIDPFGSIRQITGITDEEDLDSKIHGKKKYCNIGNWGGFKVTTFNPFGWIATSNHRLALDFFGFRLKNKKETVFDLGVRGKSENLNIAIMGGSFGSGIYANPGNEYIALLEDMVNKELKAKKTDRKVNMVNLSQGSVLQYNNFNYITHLHLLENIDLVIWIDGLNDLTSTKTSCDYEIELPIPFTIPGNDYTAGFTGFKKPVAKESEMLERIYSFLRLRRTMNLMLSGCGIEAINILQPVNNLNRCVSTSFTDLTLKHMDQMSFNRIKYYEEASALTKAIGESEYDMEFIEMNPEENYLDFWDEAHLSPAGELQYATYLKSILENRIDFLK